MGEPRCATEVGQQSLSWSAHLGVGEERHQRRWRRIPVTTEGAAPRAVAAPYLGFFGAWGEGRAMCREPLMTWSCAREAGQDLEGAPMTQKSDLAMVVVWRGEEGRKEGRRTRGSQLCDFAAGRRRDPRRGSCRRRVGASTGFGCREGGGGWPPVGAGRG